MVVKTLIVNTMPRRAAEDIVTQDGGVLRARSSRRLEPPSSVWNPFQELPEEERVLLHRIEFPVEEQRGAIPNGMEGSYYL